MSKKPVIEVGEQDFEREVLSCGLPTLVDFWGPACGPCRALEPVIEQLAHSHTGRLKVAKVNVDAHPQVAVRYSVKALPTLLLFAGGKVRDQFTGRPTPAALEKFVAAALEKFIAAATSKRR